MKTIKDFLWGIVAWPLTLLIVIGVIPLVAPEDDND